MDLRHLDILFSITLVPFLYRLWKSSTVHGRCLGSLQLLLHGNVSIPELIAKSILIRLRPQRHSDWHNLPQPALLLSDVLFQIPNWGWCVAIRTLIGPVLSFSSAVNASERLDDLGPVDYPGIDVFDGSGFADFNNAGKALGLRVSEVWIAQLRVVVVRVVEIRPALTQVVALVPGV